MALRDWLESRAGEISGRWHGQVRIREDRRGEEGDGLVRSFLEYLTRILPHTLGDQRDDAEEIWRSATHLYGSLALLRGLASGEVLEELQQSREVILRLIFQDQAAPGFREPAFFRDLLILNRILDAGVVQAGVAYVDDLFFSHLQGSGVPGPLTPELEVEIQRQLDYLMREVEELNQDGG